MKLKLCLVTDAIAANPESGLTLIEDNPEIQRETRKALIKEFKKATGTTKERVVPVANKLKTSKHEQTAACGRLLEWSNSNFRDE